MSHYVYYYTFITCNKIYFTFVTTAEEKKLVRKVDLNLICERVNLKHKTCIFDDYSDSDSDYFDNYLFYSNRPQNDQLRYFYLYLLLHFVIITRKLTTPNRL